MAKDSILRLKVESSEYDAKLKKAAEGIQHLAEVAHRGDGDLTGLEKSELDFIKALGSMETKSRSAAGQVRELSSVYKELAYTYRQMSEAEKNGDAGRALSASLEQLRQRALAAKKAMADVNGELSGSKFGQFGSILDGIGQKMGLNANITELLTSKTALMSAGIGAAGAIVGKATQEWAKYNAELAKQDQITNVTTGLKGADSDRMTDFGRAVSDTYGVDFREVINAANTLMTQFGESGDEAMQLIRDGMQGMIMGDGPKLLTMLQQYAPAFRDAGIAADQLIAIIHNSEGGLFTDQKMNAIVMGIKNLRLMTKATSDALSRLGIDGQQMSRQMSDGTLTVFEAMRQVSEAIQRVGSGSQAAGEVMQQVFGRQGTAAGTKLGEAIATLNTNLSETKRQTGELGNSYAQLQTANEKLNKAIRDCFEYDGWDQMATGIKSGLVSALASVIEKLATIKQFLTGMSANDYLKQMGGSDKVNRMVGMLGNGQGNARNTYDRQVGEFEAYINPRKKYLENLDAWRRGNRSDDVKAEVEWGRNKFGIDDRAIRNSVRAAESQLEEYQKKAEQVFSNVNKKSGEINIDLTGGNKGGNKGGKTTTPTTAPVGSVATLTRQMQELQKEQQLVTSPQAWQDYAMQIDAVNDKIAVMKGELPKDKEAVFTISVADGDTIDKLKEIKGVTIDPKTLTVVADTQDAMRSVQQLVAGIDGTTVTLRVKPKFVPDVSFKDVGSLTDGWMGKTFEQFSQQTITMKQKVALEMQAEQVKIDQETLKTMLQTTIAAGIDSMDFQFGVLGDKIAKGIDIPDESWRRLEEQINEHLKEMGIRPIDVDLTTGKQRKGDGERSNSGNGRMERTMNRIAKVMSGLNSVIGGLEKIGVELPDELNDVVNVIDGLMTVTQGVMTIIDAIQTPSQIANTAALVANTASLDALALVIAAKGFLFSNGGVVHAANGIVSGTTYSMDQVPAMLNAGEVVLNRAQAGSVAAQLQDREQPAARQMQPYVDSEHIYLGLRNYGRRTGRGELVFSRDK